MLNLGEIKGASQIFFLPDRLVIITSSSKVYALGANDNGQLCIGSIEENVTSG